MEELIKEILADMTKDLKSSDNFDSDLLESKIKRAIYEIRKDRNYPSYYTETMIVEDLKTFYSNIYDLALYDYNQVGAEGETSHSENGISRAWKSRRECKDGVVAFCNSL